jgi:hypothetical protein
MAERGKASLIPINSRLCIKCGFTCYRSSDAGKEELRVQRLMEKYKPLEDGGECRRCVHWYHRCTLGFPEGGTALAELCAARELGNVLE